MSKAFHSVLIEFPENRSQAFGNVIRVCKKFPTFREFEESGIRLYSLELSRDQMDAFDALMTLMHGWHQVSIYMNGKLCTRAAVQDAVAEEKRIQYNAARRMKLEKWWAGKKTFLN